MTRAVFIDGQAGTTGLDIARRLAAMPQITLRTLPDDQRKSASARSAAMRGADLMILCLPDEAARASVEIAAALGSDAPKILDASTAHRTAPGWTYGFAELCAGQPGRIAQAGRVANPGCYATGAIALLHPLVAAGLIPAATPLAITAVSGYSGGGHAMIAAHERDGGPAFELYALGLAHKHLPEIVAHAGLARDPIFVPAVVHLRQGMLVTIPLHLDALPRGTGVTRLHQALADHYGSGGQVRVIAADRAGRMRAEPPGAPDLLELSVHGNASQAVLIARLDNLGKGASGAAVQNMRLMLGLSG